jgi:arginyl-tRNA synthetase
MSLPLIIKQRLLTLVREQFNLSLDDIASEVPPRTDLGDLAFPLAFELAKKIKADTGEKRNPRDIAAQLAASLRDVDGVARVEVAGAGYLNVFFITQNSSEPSSTPPIRQSQQAPAAR